MNVSVKAVKGIIEDIIDDISGRSGLGDEWESIDDKTKDDIREEWAELISKRLLTNG